jgi:hypothetical protein
LGEDVCLNQKDGRMGKAAQTIATGKGLAVIQPDSQTDRNPTQKHTHLLYVLHIHETVRQEVESPSFYSNFKLSQIT